MEGMMSLLYFLRFDCRVSWAHFEPPLPPLSMDTKSLVVSWFELVSVRPLCSLCLGGESLLAIAHHRDTEDTEVTQRKLKLGHYPITRRGREALTIFGFRQCSDVANPKSFLLFQSYVFEKSTCFARVTRAQPFHPSLKSQSLPDEKKNLHGCVRPSRWHRLSLLLFRLLLF